VLAGLLEAQADDVAAAFAPWCGELARAPREGWVRLEGVRRA
jgi:hypothetical protein